MVGIGHIDPLFDPTLRRQFLDYGFEQQGAIVEEYVCCRALDPAGARTQRLFDLISDVMPLVPLPEGREADVILPWADVQLDRICS